MINNWLFQCVSSKLNIKVMIYEITNMSSFFFFHNTEGSFSFLLFSQFGWLPHWLAGGLNDIRGDYQRINPFTLWKMISNQHSHVVLAQRAHLKYGFFFSFFLFIKKIWYGSNKTTNILSQHLLHDWKIGLWFPNEIKYFQCQGSILYAK